jgi:hypothetical protein
MPREATGGPTREIAGELRGGYVGASKPDSGQIIRVLLVPPGCLFSSGLGSAKSSNVMAL